MDAADTSNVSYEHGGFGVSVPLLSGWEYKVEEYSADGMSYGVSSDPLVKMDGSTSTTGLHSVSAVPDWKPKNSEMAPWHLRRR